MGAMPTATMTVHRGKPIWLTDRGAELLVVYMGISMETTAAG